MTPFETEAYEQMRRKFNEIGDAIVLAHKRILRLYAANDPVAVAYATRRAFELTELARQCAEEEAQRRCRLEEPIQNADRLLRILLQVAREEMPSWTPIIILYSPDKDEAAVGSNGPATDVKAMLLTVLSQLTGPGLPEILEAYARVLRQEPCQTIPEAL